MVAALAIGAAAARHAQAQTAGDAIVRGRVERLTHDYGDYARYVPQGSPRGLLVLVHGSIAENDAAIDAADLYIRRWTELADERGVVVLAPAFDQANYGGHAGPGGGYRGLFGRHVGADIFVNALVEATRLAFPELPERFHLYGHSAGGQFVSRYVVMHPERVARAVICAAGTFAFPDPDVTWTNGMRRLRRRMRWSDDAPWGRIDVKPDPAGWLAAAQLPITVVVGSRDTAPVKETPGNPGGTHVERARHWVEAMTALARKHDKTSRVRLVTVPDVGHNSAMLTPACQEALFDADRSERD